MDLFNVYPLFNIEPIKGEDVYVYDNNGVPYLDLYGGHAVISIGHSHPHYVKMISEQVSKIGFYSNSVQNSLQKELAQKLGDICGYPDYNLFLCNSGAEANENALKLASFTNGKKKVIAFKKGFHGRTSAAVAVTDNPSIIAPINANLETVLLTINDIDAVKRELEKGDVTAVIVEGIQGIGGIYVPEPEFLESLEFLCKANNAMLILDEIQSGYGRSGKFFAHQYSKVKPDIITVAKGMGNGFPIGGVLINPAIEAKFGVLGTTFGGNHLACAAAIAVLDVIKNESLTENAFAVGNYLLKSLKNIDGIKEVRGYGLMIGIEFETEIKPIREKLLHENHIFTGVSGKYIIRLLPPLTLKLEQADAFLDVFKKLI